MTYSRSYVITFFRISIRCQFGFPFILSQDLDDIHMNVQEHLKYDEVK